MSVIYCSIQMPASEYRTNAGWVAVMQCARHRAGEMSGLSQLSQQRKRRITPSASLGFAGGVTLQSLTPGPACGSSSDHPAPYPAQERGSAVTRAHREGENIQDSRQWVWPMTSPGCAPERPISYPLVYSSSPCTGE